MRERRRPRPVPPNPPTRARVPFAKKESAGISRGFKVEPSMSHLERRGRERIAALIRFDSSDALTLIPPAMG